MKTWPVSYLRYKPIQVNRNHINYCLRFSSRFLHCIVIVLIQFESDKWYFNQNKSFFSRGRLAQRERVRFWNFHFKGKSFDSLLCQFFAGKINLLTRHEAFFYKCATLSLWKMWLNRKILQIENWGLSLWVKGLLTTSNKPEKKMGHASTDVT